MPCLFNRIIREHRTIYYLKIYKCSKNVESAFFDSFSFFSVIFASVHFFFSVFTSVSQRITIVFNFVDTPLLLPFRHVEALISLTFGWVLIQLSECR